MTRTNLQEIKKQEKKLYKPVKQIQNSKETVKEFLLKNVCITFDPILLSKKFEKKYIPEYRKNNESNKEMDEAASKLFMAYGLDTNLPIAEIAIDKYKPLVLQFSRELSKELDCQNASEKALAQIVINSYTRILEFSEEIRKIHLIEFPSQGVVGLFNLVSKELDRAHRQFITALTTLKQLKSPALNINIKADSAFMADKQLNFTNKTNNEINNLK